jgi:Flp pilus assembly protein TadG
MMAPSPPPSKHAVRAKTPFLRLPRDQRGASAVLVALTLPVLLAVGMLGINSGWWYTIKRQNQSAADAGAISAAYEVMAGQTNVTTNLIPAATEAATQNGYAGGALTSGGASCTVSGSVLCYPYSDAYVSNGVAVILQQDQGSLFAYAPLGTATIATKAVAVVVKLDNPCMILLNPTAPKELDIQGSASLSMPNCSIVADSTASDSVYAQGANNSILTADTIITAGQVSTTGQPKLTLTKPAQIGAPNYPDPFASTLTHTFLTTGMPTSCTTPPPQNNTTNYSGGSRFCGGLQIKKATVNLAPGTYWITDGDLNLDSNSVLACPSCVPGGAGVTIILTTGAGMAPTPATKIVGNVQEQSNAVVDSLNAPGSGPFAGLLLVQDSNNLPAGTTYTTPCPGNTSCSNFQGTPGQTLTGLVYFPKNPLTFQGNPTSGSTSCLLVVANTLTLAGNSSLDSSGCVSGGPGSPPTVKTIMLAG